MAWAGTRTREARRGMHGGSACAVGIGNGSCAPNASPHGVRVARAHLLRGLVALVDAQLLREGVARALGLDRGRARRLLRREALAHRLGGLLPRLLDGGRLPPGGTLTHLLVASPPLLQRGLLRVQGAAALLPRALLPLAGPAPRLLLPLEPAHR